jgi:hypothetical protein
MQLKTPPNLPLPVWVDEILERIDSLPTVLELTRQLQQERDLVKRLRAQRNLLINELAQKEKV